MIHVFVENTTTLNSAPSSRRATATRKFHIMESVGIAVNTVVIYVVIGMFVWPKLVLSIDSVETYIRLFIFAKGELSNVTLAVDCIPVFIFSIETYIFAEIEVLLAQHRFNDLFIAE